MSLDAIKQNIKTMVEVSDFYNDLIKEREKVNRRKAKIIETKMKDTEGYVLKLTENIKKLVEKEKKDLQKNVW